MIRDGFSFDRTPVSTRSKRIWSGTLQSVVISVCVFYLGRELAVWLNVRSVHGFWGFLDNLAAAIAAGLLVLVYERRRWHAVDKLRESEERLRLAQWAAHIGTFDLNLRTGVDIWQPETEALYGLPPGGFGGTLTAFEDLIHPNDRERVIELNKEMVRTGQPAEAEWRVVWPDGSVHWIPSRGQVFMNEAGESLLACLASTWISPSASRPKRLCRE